VVDYKADVEVNSEHIDENLPETPVGEVPDHIFHYLMPTRFCESDVLGSVAQQMFGSETPGIGRVRGIVKWIHDAIEYRPGSTNSTSTAQEVFVQRAGVCRDFAHLGIALCRALGIPARFVSAYAYQLQPPDFHAVFEAWIGDRCYLFDPTRQAALDGIVRIGVGRDASEVSFASIHGKAEPTEMEVRIEAAEEDRSRTRTTDAISTATR
jgi:transglutaminase-like putative cysteine protease